MNTKSDIIVSYTTLSNTIKNILILSGVPKSKAEECAIIFTDNTCDGVISHGINRLPYFIDFIKKGFINPNAEPKKVSSLGAMEQWDGQSGIGMTNAKFAMNRAVSLANKFGIGCIGLKNTNHWMRAGTYPLIAAKNNCIGLCWTNSPVLMPPWGASEKKIGNNPIAIAVPSDNEPILLDMAMSIFSNGKLEVLAKQGEELPFPGGYNSKGELTTNPSEILQSRRALPIGMWKGSGMALMLDLMATAISGGNSTKDIGSGNLNKGISQVFIAINPALTNQDYKKKMSEIIDDFLTATPIDRKKPIRYPGQKTANTRKENLKYGIPINIHLWIEIKEIEKELLDIREY